VLSGFEHPQCKKKASAIYKHSLMGRKNKMIRIIRTSSEIPILLNSIKKLDLDLAERDGKRACLLCSYNKIDKIKYAVVAYGRRAAGWMRRDQEYEPNVMEVKRCTLRRKAEDMDCHPWS